MSAEFQYNSRSAQMGSGSAGRPEAANNALDADARLWELLSAYADGETTPAETEEVEALLRSDAAYARDLEFLRLTADSVPRLCEVEPPAGLREAILARTTRRETPAKRLAAAWRSVTKVFDMPTGRAAVGIGGALAAAGMAAFLFLPHSGGHSFRPSETQQPVVVSNVPAPKAPEEKKSSVPSALTTAPTKLAIKSTAQIAANTKTPDNSNTEDADTSDTPGILEGTPITGLLNTVLLKAKSASSASDTRKTVAAAKPNTVHNTPVVKPTLRGKVNNTQVASNIDSTSHRDLSKDWSNPPYSVNPKMDDINQRRVATIASSDTEDTQKGEVVVAENPAGTATSETHSAPVSTSAGRLVASRLAALPPSEQFSPSNKELFASLRARTGGLPDDVIRNNERGQAQITLARMVLR